MAKVNDFAKQQIDAIKEKCEMIKPLVVVRCVVYNHEHYIKDTLDGFVMQKTDFPFVAIVHDDASSDKTAEIIKEYAEKYPNIILPILEKENQFSKGNGSIGKILNPACRLTGAKYIAMCEGDDYWIDPNKLQKQVDFLEAHPEYSLCFHSVNIESVGIDDHLNVPNSVEDRDYVVQEILTKWIIPTCSVVFKREIIEKKPIHPDFIVGDNILWSTCSVVGKMRGMSDIMGVYRRISSGWTAEAYKSRESVCKVNKKWIKHYKTMASCFPTIEPALFDKLILEKMIIVSQLDLLMLRKDFFKDILLYVKEYKYKFIKGLTTSLFSSLFSAIRKKAKYDLKKLSL